MAEDWKTQLESEDPRVRVEAIKAIANSGDRANLPYLKEIVENDPDPRLQDYARKAARHLFTSTESSAPAKAESQDDVKPSRERKTPTQEPLAAPPAERTSAETKIQRALSLHMRGDTTKALKAFAQGLDLDPNLANETFTRSVASELTGLHPDQALEILMDPEDRKALLNPPKGKTAQPEEKPELEEAAAPKKPAKPRSGLVQTWLSFFRMTEDFLAEEADRANTEDTLISVLVFTIAAVVIFMIAGFVQFQQFLVFWGQLMVEMGESMPPLDINIGMIFFVLLIGTLILTPLIFFIAGGLQFLGARIFSGSGDFKSHLYLLALIQVPFTILGGVLSMVGLVSFMGFVTLPVGFVLSIYTLIITVRAVKAAHNLPTGRAVAGVFLLPIILTAILGCLLVIFFGPFILGIWAMGVDGIGAVIHRLITI